MDEDIQNLSILLGAMKKNHLGREEFDLKFEEVLKLIIQIEKKNEDQISEMKRTTEMLEEYIKGENEKKHGETMQKVDGHIGEMKGKHEEMMKRMEEKMSIMKDGQDSDPNTVAEIVKGMIEIPEVEDIEKNLAKLGEPIRDGLELLQGDDRLDVSAIKGLDERLKEFEGKNRVIGGGGFSKMSMTQYFVDNEVPTDSGDHLTFTLNHTPSPASSFKLYRSRARQNVTEDYTLVGKTLTLTVAFDSANESLYCDYLR